MKKLLVIVFALALCMGCAGKKAPEPGFMEDGRPAWIIKGSKAFIAETEKSFYGVGSAWGIKNPSLLRGVAETRARTEIGAIFSTYTARLTKAYASATMGNEEGIVSEAQNVERTCKEFTKAKLSGVEIIDHWKDPETGEYFALAKMNLDIFEDYLRRAPELSENARQSVVRQANLAFEELAREEAKH